MPAGKLYQYKPKRKYVSKRRSSTKSNKQLTSMVYSALKKARTESKFHNVAYAAVQEDYDGSIDTLNEVPQGVTDSTRIGDSLFMKSINFNYEVFNESLMNYTSATARTGEAALRVILFYDKQNTIDTVAEYLASTGGTNAYLASKRHDKRFETILLYDRIHTNSFNSRSLIAFRKNIKINKYSQFSNAGIGINSGALKIITISDQVVGGSIITMKGVFKLWYTDK